MVDIKLLDKALNYLLENENIALIYGVHDGFTKEENDFLRQAMRHLEKDGYAESHQKNQYLLSFDGLLAMDETYLFLYKNQPYQRMRFKARVMSWWTVVKIIAVVVYSVILLALAVGEFIFKD